MTQIITYNHLLSTHAQLPDKTKVVLVTGVFDILHSQHQKLLQKAKKLGDKLVVGLESDSRVKKLKGDSRPQNTINKRLNNIKDLNTVDYVFKLPNLSTSKKRQTFIKKLKPHILAVSASTPHLSQKRRLMRQVDGHVKVILPHNPAISTTKIVQSLQT